MSYKLYHIHTNTTAYYTIAQSIDSPTIHHVYNVASAEDTKAGVSHKVQKAPQPQSELGARARRYARRATQSVRQSKVQQDKTV